MKVLHISSGNLYGGVEVMLATLSREREVCSGMEPHFALCFPGRLSEELAAAGTPATILSPVQTRYPWRIWQVRRRLSAFLRQHAFDAVICHMPWSLAVFGPAVCRAGVPLVFWMHDRANGKHWIERWAGRVQPDLAICNSRFTSESLGRLFPRRNPPYSVIHCPVARPAQPPLSTEERAAIRLELSTADENTVIIQVSRMEPYKGHSLHLAALGQLSKIPGWTCWIVGGAQRPHEQAYLSKLQAQAAAAGIADRVRFLGERRDVPRLLAAADIFCQPNLHGEPFGIVFIEALQAGLPVVTTALGGALEIIDQRCGRLVPADAPESLTDTLLHLLTIRELREQLGGAGPVRAQSLCSPAAVISKLSATLAALPPDRACERQTGTLPLFSSAAH